MIQKVVYNDRNTLHLLRSTLLLALVGLCRKKFWVDKRYDTTLADDDIAQEFVQPDKWEHYLNVT